MSITLTVGATTVVLPSDLYWEDESTWSLVQQAVERSITGALVIDVAARVGGRPITLGRDPDGAQESAWASRADLEQLLVWSNEPGRQMTLTLRGTARTVIFAHQDGAGIEAEPVVHHTDTNASDYYRIKLRLMEI